MVSGITTWIDGRFVDCTEATVPLLSHSFSRGSAVFEVMAVTSTPRGPAFFCLEEHLDRFLFSAGQTYMELPFSRETIREALMELARINSVTTGLAKFFAYYPGIEFGTTPSGRVSVAVFCLNYTSCGITKPSAGASVSVGISSYRKLHPMTTDVHAKVVGNYVNGYLARMESRSRGFDEALMLDAGGLVAEGPTSNVFFVRGNDVETPTEENVLPGITRRVIMEVLDDMGLPEKQVHIRPGDIQQYDEAFFSGTTTPVLPIRSIEQKSFSCPGPVTLVVRQKMEEVLRGGSPRHEKFLTLIPKG